MECANCKGPAHPASGCQFSAHTILCHVCAGRFWAWVVSHTNKKARRKSRNVCAVSFYEAAATSVKPSK